MPQPGYKAIEVKKQAKDVFRWLCAKQKRFQWAEFEDMLDARLKELGYKYPEPETPAPSGLASDDLEHQSSG